MKARLFVIGILLLLCVACHTPTREARRMVKRAEQLVDTLPDRTVRLIDSVLHMPVYFSERERMDMALLQAEALFGDRGTDLSPIMDDDFFDDHADLSTSPELERAATYFAQKKQYTKAAHAALYSGFVQQHYDEKENAMRSFKEAEQYGKLAVDSLAVARAEYKMGRMLFYDDMVEDALLSLKSAEKRFGNQLAEKAFVQNFIAGCYLVLGDDENTEFFLQQSLINAKKSHVDKVKRKAINNYAVLYQLQGKYNQAIACLKLNADNSKLDEKELLLLNLNLGNVFFVKGNMDSATYYFKCVDSLLPNAKVKLETKVSAYNSLSQFAESQGNDSLALYYWKYYDNWLNEVRDKREQSNVYGIQQKYDYGTLQNTMNQKVIRRQRLIIVLSIVMVLVLLAFAISQIRLARIRKQEAEAKASLFHFMQQNKELAKKHETSEKALADISMMHKAEEKAYQDLIRKNSEIESACNTYAQQLSDALNKEALTMRKLDIFLKNREEKAYLAALKDAVFNDEDPWEALMGVFDSLYPDVRSNLALQHPELTEMEQKDFILSYFNVSRDEEASLFQKSIHTVDKLRNTVRQKMKQSAVATAPKLEEKA